VCSRSVRERVPALVVLSASLPRSIETVALTRSPRCHVVTGAEGDAILPHIFLVALCRCG